MIFFKKAPWWLTSLAWLHHQAKKLWWLWLISAVTLGVVLVSR